MPLEPVVSGVPPRDGRTVATAAATRIRVSDAAPTVAIVRAIDGRLDELVLAASWPASDGVGIGLALTSAARPLGSCSVPQAQWGSICSVPISAIRASP